MTSIGSAAPMTSLVDLAQEIAPLLRQHSANAERERDLPEPVVHAMREAGLYRMWRPKAFGGLEVDPMTAFRVVEEVSRVDSAAGWNLQLSNGLDYFGAWFPDDGASEIFGSADAILAGAFFPFRRAVAVESGYRVTGQTPFVSGARHAAWICGLAHVYDGETPRLENGLPVTIITACPAKDAEIIDTWHTLGMRGTGSHDVKMTDVFVPARRAALLAPLEKPGRAYVGPIYRFTIWAPVAVLCTPALGTARAAIDELLKLALRKSPSYTAKALKDRSTIQTVVGQAEATLGAARAYLYQALEEVWAEALKGRTIDMAGKIKLQLAATHAGVEAARAVDLVHGAVGTTGVRNEHPFQRYFRDVHTITQHGYISASRYESVGQLMLDAPVEWPFFGL